MKPYKRQKNNDAPETTSKYYLSNSKLLPAVIESKAQGKISDTLAQMLLTLTRRYAQRPCFSGYTYKEDMISEALANLCQNALKFKPEVSSNPFSFYTSCINNSFLQFLGSEKKHRRIRDQMLIDIGENPSFNFQEESKNQLEGEFKDEFNDLKTQMKEAKIRLDADAAYAEAKAAAIALEKSLLEENKDEISEVCDDMGCPTFDDFVNSELISNTSLLEFDEVEDSKNS